MKESNASLHDEITGLKAEVKSLEDTIKQMQNEITTVAQNNADSISGGNRIGSPDSRNQTQISSPTPSSGSVYGKPNNDAFILNGLFSKCTLQPPCPICYHRHSYLETKPQGGCLP